MNIYQSSIRKTASRPGRCTLAAAISAIALSGCYAIPVGQGPDGSPYYVYSPVPIVPTRSGVNGAQPVAVPAGPMPAVLNVKLYPSNDLANHTGVLTGQVTNMMTGKGRISLN